MRILIFGTGNAATYFIEDHKEYFEDIKILAFIDNNKKKIGNKFHEKKIISVQDIFKYDYDIILICSVYEEEIYSQLVFDAGIYEKKIYTRRIFFSKIIFPWYDKKYNLYNKNILIITEDCGTELDYEKYFGLYCELFNIVGIINLNQNYLISNYNFDYIFITDFKPPSIYRTKNNNVLEKLKNMYEILTIKIIDIYFNNIKEMCYGEDYKDKKFLVIKCDKPLQGLGAKALFISQSIQFANKEGYIPIVDMKIPRFLKKREYGKVNTYTKFFKQPTIYNLEDIKNAKSVSVVYDRKWLSKKDIDKLVFPKMQNQLYTEYSKFKKKFYGKKVLGVLFRGTDYTNLKPFGHNIQPDLSSMVKIVKRKLLDWSGFDMIFLCTEVQEACNVFEDEFGKEKVCYYPQLRYKLDTKKYLADIDVDAEEHIQQERGYWIALNLLASCDSIVAGKCTGTEIALIMNKHQYKNSYLFELGRYGIDDV